MNAQRGNIIFYLPFSNSRPSYYITNGFRKSSQFQEWRVITKACYSRLACQTTSGQAELPPSAVLSLLNSSKDIFNLSASHLSCMQVGRDLCTCVVLVDWALIQHWHALEEETRKICTQKYH